MDCDLINSYGLFTNKKEDAIGYGAYFAIEDDTEYVLCIVVCDYGITLSKT